MYEDLDSIDGNFTNKDIISIRQFETEDVNHLLSEAEGMESMKRHQGRDTLLDDLIIADLFYQPSTRTFASFEAAAKRLGAATVAIQGVEYSSIAKGETLEHTVKTMERYVDIITLRHSRIGSAALAAKVTKIPIINGGDGIGEHPTQAFTDVLTLKQKLGHLDGLTIGYVGDLKNGRTVHSLAQLHALYGGKQVYVSPSQLSMPKDVVEEVKNKGVEQYITSQLMEVIGEVDALYVTRVQKEYFNPTQGIFKTQRGRLQYSRVKNTYIIDNQMLKHVKDDMILMHPMPIVNEIKPEVDNNYHAVYFDQVESGLYVRMALLALLAGRSILSKSIEPAHDLATSKNGVNPSSERQPLSRNDPKQ